MGIGTATPTAPLHIEGGTTSEALKIEADANPYARWVENGTNVGFLQFSSTNAYLSNMSNGSFFIRTNSTDKMTITAGGNVGIGTTSPATKLHVFGTTSSLPALGAPASAAQMGGSAYGTLFSTLTSGVGVIQQGRNDGTATSYNLSLQPSGGNLGIGTTSPGKKLTIGGIGIGNTDGLKIEDPSNTAYGAHFSFDDGSTTVEIGGVTNNTLNDCISIARDATRTITIDTSERVGIGTTTPSYKLDVSGDAYIDETLNIETTISGTLTLRI